MSSLTTTQKTGCSWNPWGANPLHQVGGLSHTPHRHWPVSKLFASPALGRPQGSRVLDRDRPQVLRAVLQAWGGDLGLGCLLRPTSAEAGLSNSLCEGRK